MPWTIAPTDTEIVAIHAALLPTSAKGEILLFGDWKDPQVGTTHTRIYAIDPESLSNPQNLPSQNLFCGGQAFLADGRLLIAGGTVAWPEVPGDQDLPPGKPHGHHYNGERAAYIYLPRQRRFVQVADLGFQPGSSIGGGRWYPTLVTLPSGQVWAVAGHPDISDNYEGRHNNNTPEYYSPSTNKWTVTTAARTAPGSLNTDSYPRFHLLPNGLLLSDTAGLGDGKRLFDPFAGTWTDDSFSFPVSWDAGFYDRGSSATSVLLPLVPPLYKPRVLMTNGGLAFKCDPDVKAFSGTAARQGSAVGKVRNHGCAVILPTGKVLVTGGVSYHAHPTVADASFARGVYETEIYDPGDFGGPEGWSTLGAGEESSVLRGYHSVALLLPDGRIWAAGSTEGYAEVKGTSTLTGAGGAEHRVEVYSPSYVSQANRPSISSCPANIGYNMGFQVGTAQAETIARVALIRCGSVTHAFNSDQRYIGLNFSKGNSVLNVTSPPDAKIAPPGYYMLWIIDNQGRVCQLAKFIRVCAQKCEINLDVSTFSKHEAQAAGTPARFTEAVYVVYDGFLPGEVAQPTIVLRRPDNSAPPGMHLDLVRTEWEARSGETDTAQRVVYVYDVTFDNNQTFDQIPAADSFQTVTLRAEMKHYVCTVPLTLSKNPNPFMRDGDPPWLSVDLRVFKTRNYATENWGAGIEHGAGGNAPFEYISALLTEYNNAAGQANHPFDKIDSTQEGSRLALYGLDSSGKRVYNYAVARVRFRAPGGVNANDVRMFFRLCTTGWTGLEYDTARSYRRHGNGPGAVPLLGLIGGEINTVPCFAAPRVLNASMTTQTDPLNRRTLNGAGNTEVHAYFGCWLDINDTAKAYPLQPGDDGPFQELWPGYLRRVQELMRGLHQCLVAEIHYTLDPIPPNATPGTSDNLAQRNILLDESDNPGGFGTHLVHHTFELKPTAYTAAHQLPIPALPPGGGAAGGELGQPGHHHPRGAGPVPAQAQPAVVPVVPVHGHVHVHGGAAPATTAAPSRAPEPDYLMIHWGNLPRDTHASFYFPSIDTEALLAYESLRHGPGNLSRGEDRTVNVKVTDVGFVTIPGSPRAIPALVTLQLPPGVVSGQRFRVVMQQVQRRTHKIIGTVEFYVMVKHSAAIVPELKRNFSVLKGIGATIPGANRWHPVWERYLGQMGTRLRAFGEDPEKIGPSWSGDGKDEGPGGPGHDHPGHDHPGHDHPGHGHPGGADCETQTLTGVIEAMEYDCDGKWSGFRLKCCEGTRRFSGCGRALEDVIRRCCEERSTVTVTATDKGAVVSVSVHCC
ncbi:MAG: DUF1929 domain-containing protein [Acidobacteria bacterium]|nr:DUF1929 domain-containing protein [Acidobacteriota bacterium]